MDIKELKKQLADEHFKSVDFAGFECYVSGNLVVCTHDEEDLKGRWNMAASQRVNDEIHDIFVSAKIIREVYEKLIEGKGNPVLSIRIEDCDLSVRARNVCKHVGIETLGDLTKLCKTDLFKTRMVGKGTIGEFDDLLSKYGLTWAKWESV